MCGISGMMSSSREAPARGPVDAMGAALAHRGPDGMRAYRAGDVAMTHNRLAIVDLETGDQPLFEPDGAALVANGEMNTPLSFAGMLLLTLMGIVLYFAVEGVERLTTGWHVSQRLNPAL
jgi:asparagine synthase (glutamine-hydrolysing)